MLPRRTAVNDTSQVVATGFAYSEAAGKVATVVKLTRNTLMGGVIILMGLLYAGGGQGTAGSLGQRLKQSVPPFVLGFLGMCLLNTLGFVAWASQHTGRDLIVDAQTAAKFLILMALAGVGLLAGGLALVLGGLVFRAWVLLPALPAAAQSGPPPTDASFDAQLFHWALTPNSFLTLNAPSRVT